MKSCLQLLSISGNFKPKYIPYHLPFKELFGSIAKALRPSLRLIYDPKLFSKAFTYLNSAKSKIQFFGLQFSVPRKIGMESTFHTLLLPSWEDGKL